MNPETPKPATPPAPPPPPPKGGNAGDALASTAGFVCLWVTLMAAWQNGPASGFKSYMWMVVALVVGGLLGWLVAWALRRYAAPMAALGLLAVWWIWGGTYAIGRDALVGVLVALGVLVAFPASRLWLRTWPARTLAAWQRWLADERDKASPANIDHLKDGLKTGGRRLLASMRHARNAPAAAAAPPPPKPPLEPRVAPWVLALAALSVWAALSAADAWFESDPLPRRGTVLQPPDMPAAHAPLRVGLALSGGGYRAALVHAGVVDALGDLGVPVTHLSAVSGGAIIGSFLSVGGAPRDFVEAVAEGRFRMTRDLLAVQNLVRLPSPTVLPWLEVDVWPLPWQLSRTDVQANLVDRVLLGGALPSDLPRRGPRLMVCMTDLNHGLSVGATDDGVLLIGPSAARFFRTGQAIEFPALPRLADRVAVSGAFPGAFPALPVQVRIARADAPSRDLQAQNASDLALQLADGGVRDNLGLALLEAMDRQARQMPAEGWSGFRPDPDWQLDLILVSDGGKLLQAAAPTGTLGTALRAIDLNGLATGALRTMVAGEGPPRVLFSALGNLIPSPDAAVLGQTSAALRDKQHAYLRPDTLGDDVVERLIALQGEPAAQRLRTKWAQHRQNPRGPVQPETLGTRCASAASTDPDCAWWAVVSTVGDDIWRTTQAFANTPTLSDRYTPDEARTIHRFGQYLVLLQAAALRKAVAQAIAQRR